MLLDLSLSLVLPQSLQKCGFDAHCCHRLLKKKLGGRLLQENGELMVQRILLICIFSFIGLAYIELLMEFIEIVISYDSNSQNGLEIFDILLENGRWRRKCYMNTQLL